jgi:hypothetical protein
MSRRHEEIGPVNTFDQTAPSTSALGDTATIGTSPFAARRDHKHGRESATVGGDLTGTLPNPTLATAGPGATGPIGDATHSSAVTIDAKGRVTALTSVAISGSGIDTGAVPKSTVTAAGDLIIATGSAAVTNLAAGTTAGVALAADPNATNKVSMNFPQGVEEARARGVTSGVLASTFDRGVCTETNAALLSTGRLTLVRIGLPKGLTVNSIKFYSATTALSVGTNQWFALYSSALAKLAVTADDTSTAWAANAGKSLVISGGFVTTYSGLYYLGIMVKATTVPTLGAGGSGVAIFRANGGQFTASTADSSLTNPASAPNPATLVSSLTNMPYAEVL